MMHLFIQFHSCLLNSINPSSNKITTLVSKKKEEEKKKTQDKQQQQRNQPRIIPVDFSQCDQA